MTVRMSVAGLAAGHGVHIRGIGTVIAVVVVVLLIAAIAYAAWRARPGNRRPPPDDWQHGRPPRDRKEPRPWQ